MKKTRRNVLGAAEYSISYLKSLKTSMLELGSKNHEIAWAIGGIMITLVSHLIKICEETFNVSIQKSDPSAREDLLEIKENFNKFIDRMIENE